MTSRSDLLEDLVADLTVPVPTERIAEFYEWFGRWLAQAEPPPAAAVEVWSADRSDIALAGAIWAKLSKRARDLFAALLDSPDQPISGDDLAQRLDIPNGKYGVAGVLAWPGRFCAAANRPLPVTSVEDPGQSSALYSFLPEAIQAFTTARSADRRSA